MKRFLRISAARPGRLRSSGGMTASDIKPEVYAHHYERGFTGAMLMGWDPNLQLTWSRLGAAKTWVKPFDDEVRLAQLIGRFGHDRLMHGRNGLDVMPEPPLRSESP
ncbi:hypothetical protein DBR42_15330 [Pelomonas sp. HMWF004]|nr:hypothetical protein DBR42_15330 [Pelomonas sp. HMWF004]